MFLKMRVIKKQSLGRSMLEMLCVLAVVGALSVGGLQMYMLLICKWKANNTLHDVLLRATNVPILWENYANENFYIDEFLFPELPAKGCLSTHMYAMHTYLNDHEDYLFQVNVLNVPNSVCRRIVELDPQTISGIRAGNGGTDDKFSRTHEGRTTDSVTDVCGEDKNIDVPVMRFYFDGESNHQGNNDDHEDESTPDPCRDKKRPHCAVCFQENDTCDGCIKMDDCDCTESTDPCCGTDDPCCGATEPCDCNPHGPCCAPQDICECQPNDPCCKAPNSCACNPTGPCCTAPGSCECNPIPGCTPPGSCEGTDCPPPDPTQACIDRGGQIVPYYQGTCCEEDAGTCCSADEGCPPACEPDAEQCCEARGGTMVEMRAGDCCDPTDCCSADEGCNPLAPCTPTQSPDCPTPCVGGPHVTSKDTSSCPDIGALTVVLHPTPVVNSMTTICCAACGNDPRPTAFDRRLNEGNPRCCYGEVYNPKYNVELRCCPWGSNVYPVVESVSFSGGSIDCPPELTQPYYEEYDLCCPPGTQGYTKSYGYWFGACEGYLSATAVACCKEPIKLCYYVGSEEGCQHIDDYTRIWLSCGEDPCPNDYGMYEC